jgi:hypothetical protein
MAHGRYIYWRDVYVFTCAGCGQEFEASDCISPLDGLDCCSEECDQKVEAEFERQLAENPEFRAQLEQEGII